MTLVFPFGNAQAFSLGSLSVSISAANREYAAGEGEGYLPVLGYDRKNNMDFIAKAAYNSFGTTVWEGPSFAIPQVFEWRLQRLTLAKYEAFWGLWRIQQKTKQAVILNDQRLAMSEPTPKTRQSVGTVTGAPTIPGIEYFWGVFKLELLFDESQYRRRPRLCTENVHLYDLSFKAREILA